MPTPLDDEINGLAVAFIADVTDLVRHSVLASVTEALGVSGSRATPRVHRATAVHRGGPNHPQGGPEAVERKVTQLRTEEIGKRRGVTTKELEVPTARLPRANDDTRTNSLRAATANVVEEGQSSLPELERALILRAYTTPRRT